MTLKLGAQPLSGLLNFFNHTDCVITLAPPDDIPAFEPGTTASLHIYTGSNDDTAVYNGVLSDDLKLLTILVPAEEVSEHIQNGARTFGFLFDGIGCITGKIKFFSGKNGDKNIPLDEGIE